MGVFVLHNFGKQAMLLTGELQVPHGTALFASGKNDVVIPWHCASHIPERVRTLNHPQAVKRCRDKQAMRDMLAASGIAVAAAGRRDACRFYRTYVVPVFFPDALAVLKVPNTHGAAVLFAPGKRVWLPEALRVAEDGGRAPEAKKAARQAVRAVRALDLDFANVVVLANGSRPPEVLDVEPNPVVDRKLASLYAQAIHRFAGQSRPSACGESQVVLGADPEFALISRTGELVAASRFLPLTGRIGCDAAARSDGTIHYPLAELRPRPAADPDRLVAEIRKLLQLAQERISAAHVRWLAGGMPVEYVRLGGHIHFGGIWPNPFLIRALDNYLALSLAAIEDERTARRRPRYGGLGDVRRQFHGGFEYRTLPSWLISPQIAAAVLHLAQIIAGNFGQLTQSPLSDPRTRHAYYRGDAKIIGNIARKLWRELSGLPAYQEKRERLEPLGQMILAGEKWDEQTDIRKAWGIAR
ncbi:MAG TPA: hypothetical protein VF260_04310 [Bacilli bacterium]